MTKIDLSFVVPTYNEVSSISSCLEGIKKQCDASKLGYEVLVIDDGSKDGTIDAVKKIEKENPSIKLHVRDTDKGFGAAIWYGIRHAGGEFVIPFMADLSDDPKDAMKVYEALKKGNDVVYTTRFKNGNRAYGYPVAKYFSNRAYNTLIAILFGLPYYDTSNAFKGFKTKLAKKLDIRAKGFDITTELAVKAYLNGKKFDEVSVTWNDRSAGEQKSNLFKVGIMYAKLMLHLLSYRFGLSRK